MTVPLFHFSMYINSPQAYPQLSVFQATWGRGWGPPTVALEGCVGQSPCVSCLWGPDSHEGPTHTTGSDLALSLPYVSKALFHPELDYAVFSLATPIPRCNGKKGLESSSGTDNWCLVLCSTLLPSEYVEHLLLTTLVQATLTWIVT